jgi:enamine deaminase RidA (YjgF/YER057c/UK114 family)
MMSRFTEKAQEALQMAQQLMFAKQHTQLDVEHLFLALLQQRDSLPAQIITRLGGDPRAMARRLEGALNNLDAWRAKNDDRTSGYITLRCNQVLQGAAEEAEQLGDLYASTEHIFLALSKVLEEGGPGGPILRDATIDHVQILEVLKAMGIPQSKGPSDSLSRSSLRETVLRDRARRDAQMLVVNPPELVKPIGYSHGIRATGGNLLFLGGQIAMDREGNLMAPGDVVGQYRQVLVNLESVVGEAGGEMSNIVKLTIYVKDRDEYRAHLKELGDVHREFFGTYYPATALVEISRFFEEGVLVEIEGIAVI